jgi:hypothetical protein
MRCNTGRGHHKGTQQNISSVNNLDFRDEQLFDIQTKNHRSLNRFCSAKEDFDLTYEFSHNPEMKKKHTVRSALRCSSRHIANMTAGTGSNSHRRYAN